MTMHDFDRLENIGEFLRVWLNNELLSPESQGFIEEYYRCWRQMNPDRTRFWYNNQITEAERILSQFEQPRLLEVGVGTGAECLWFALRGVGVRFQ